jgi:fucose 4-O-acetylase-like acetyltransferase
LAAKQRIAWIDIARGIGIILVVFGHVLIGLSFSHADVREGFLAAAEYTIYTFHMPLFFVLAGLNVGHSMRKGPRRFLQDKLWTIAYPYVLWSLIQGSIQVLLPHMINTPHAAKSLALILWRPIGQFWFLYALFACHFLAFLCKGRRWALTLCAAAVLLSLHWISNGLVVAVATMFPFYVVGVCTSSLLLNWHPTQRTAFFSTLRLTGALLLCAHVGRGLANDQPYALPSLPAGVAGILLIIALSHLLHSLSASLSGMLVSLGQASFTIYILHVLVGAATRVALSHLGLSSLWTQLLLGTAAGVLIPFAIHLALQRVHLLVPLGLAPLRKPSGPGVDEQAALLA